MIGLGIGLSPRRRAGPITPASYSAAWWYEFDDLSAISQDGIVAGAVDAPIGRLADRSNTGLTLSQAGTARPILRQALGRNFADFAGAQSLVSGALALPQPFTVVVATAFGASAQPFERVFDGTTVGTLFGKQGADTAILFAGTGFVATQTTPFALSVWSMVFDGVNSILRRGGVQIGAGNAGLNVMQGVSLGASGADFMTGSIYGIAGFPSRLSSAQLGEMEAYMASKAGL